MWAPGARLLINTLVYVQFKIFRGKTTGGGYECGAPGPRLSPRKPQSVSNLRDGTSARGRSRKKSSDQTFTRIFRWITKMVNKNFK